MLNQEEIHRYFNHLTGTKRIEFLYGLLHLCQPLELRYLGTCLEEIARKDYEYLYHVEQKINHLSTPVASSASTSSCSVSSIHEQTNQQLDLLSDEKLDLTDQFTRAHTIVDIALLWPKNRTCAIRLFRRLKSSESVKLVDVLLERDDLDERTMDEILIIFCLASNHPAFSFDMRTQMSQTFKELEKRQRRMKLLHSVRKNRHNNNNDDDDHNDDDDDNVVVEDSIHDHSECLGYHIVPSSTQKSNTLSVHASPLLTRLSVLNFDTDSTAIRLLIRADWSDNNSTLIWRTPNDIRSFHLQLSNIVYHDDLRLERLMNIAGYLRDVGSSTEVDIELMKKNIEIYITHLVYFSSYISTVSTLAKFFNSSLKLGDTQQRSYNTSSNILDESLPSSPSHSNGLTPLQCELSTQQQSETEINISSPKLSLNTNKSKQSIRSLIGTQTSNIEVRCEETQTDRIPRPGFILAEHQDYLRRYTMEELAKLTPNDLILDGLDSNTAHLLCSALDDLKPMSIHLSNNKLVRSPCNYIQIPPAASSAASPPPPPPLLDAALMTVVQRQQKQQSSKSSPSTSDRNQYEHILINFGGVRPPLASSPSPQLPKTGIIANGTNNNNSNNNNNISVTTAPSSHVPASSILPPPPSSSSTSASSSSSNCLSQNQHHVPLLATHSFLYNPIEPCLFPIAIQSGFPTASPDFVRLITPNMTSVAAASTVNTSNAAGPNFITNSNGSQTHASNSRTSAPSNGTHTSPEQHGQNFHHQLPSSTSSVMPRHQHYRHRQNYSMDSNQFQQNAYQPSYHYHHHHNHHQQQQQRQSQITYSQQQPQQQQYSQTKACYTCGDIGHLSFACPEQYTSDSNYSHNTKDGYKLDYRPRQKMPTNNNYQQQQKQMRSNSISKVKLRDNT